MVEGGGGGQIRPPPPHSPLALSASEQARRADWEMMPGPDNVPSHRIFSPYWRQIDHKQIVTEISAKPG